MLVTESSEKSEDDEVTEVGGVDTLLADVQLVPVASDMMISK